MEEEENHIQPEGSSPDTMVGYFEQRLDETFHGNFNELSNNILQFLTRAINRNGLGRIERSFHKARNNLVMDPDKRLKTVSNLNSELPGREYTRLTINEILQFDNEQKNYMARFYNLPRNRAFTTRPRKCILDAVGVDGNSIILSLQTKARFRNSTRDVGQPFVSVCDLDGQNHPLFNDQEILSIEELDDRDLNRLLDFYQINHTDHTRAQREHVLASHLTLPTERNPDIEIKSFQGLSGYIQFIMYQYFLTNETQTRDITNNVGAQLRGYEDKFNTLATSIESMTSSIAELTSSIDTLRTGLNTSIDTLRTDLNTSIDTLRTDLNTSIDTLRTEMNTSNRDIRNQLETGIRDVRADNREFRAKFNTRFNNMMKDFSDPTTFIEWIEVGNQIPNYPRNLALLQSAEIETINEICTSYGIGIGRNLSTGDKLKSIYHHLGIKT